MSGRRAHRGSLAGTPPHRIANEPTARVAVLVHQAIRAEHELERAGFSMVAMRQAIELLRRDPGEIEAEQQQIANLLVAMRAPGVEVETIDVVTRMSDETQAQVLERIRRAGYCAAVLDRPRDGSGHPEGSVQRQAWDEGWRAFRADLDWAEAARSAEAAA